MRTKMRQRRRTDFAWVNGKGATLLERATFRQILQIRRITSDGAQLFQLHVHARYCTEQANTVRVRRAVENIIHATVLHRATGVHDQNLITNPRNHAQIMGNQNNRGVKIALKFIEQRHNLRLNRHVQGRGRLIRDQQFRATQ